MMAMMTTPISFMAATAKSRKKKGLVTPETRPEYFPTQSLEGPGNWIYTKELGSQ
jgi:hypothetical protein